MDSSVDRRRMEELEYLLVEAETRLAQLGPAMSTRQPLRQHELEQEVETLRQAVEGYQKAVARMEATRVWRMGVAFWRFRRRLAERALSVARRVLPGAGRRAPIGGPPASGAAPAVPGVAADGMEATLAEAGEDQSAPHAGYDVIYLPVVEWRLRSQRPQQMAMQFAAHDHRVFYVNPLKVIPILSRSGRSFANIALSKNVWDTRLVSPRRPMLYREQPDEPMLRAMLDSLEQMRRVYAVNEAVCIVQFPFWARLALELRRRFGWRIIYDCMEDWQTVQGVEQPALQQEEELVRSCDALVVPSRRLLSRWQGRNPRSLVVRNGIDARLFAAACTPNDRITDLAHPIIGYSGVLASWFDVELVRRLALSRPQWNFALLGTIAGADLSPLQDLPNVRLLGAQPPTAVPAYLYHFDACILPYQINDTTTIMDPLNFYEYMSAGKPVVATPMPELLRHEGYLSFAATAEEFIAQLEAALSECDPALVQRRKILARMNSWLGRYREMDKVIRSIYPTVTIVVAFRNNPQMARQCIQAIYAGKTYPSFDVIVVDDASTDETRAYLNYASATYPGLRVIHNAAPRGSVQSLQIGAAAAQGERIVLLGSDALVPRGWLDRLVCHLDDETIGVVGAVSNIATGDAQVSAGYDGIEQMPTFARAYMDEQRGRVGDAAALDGFCLALRRQTLAQIGAWPDESSPGAWLAQQVRQRNLRAVLAHDVYVHRVRGK